MTDKRNCGQCSTEYEPRYYDVLSTHILVGGGNCPGCATNLYDAEAAKDILAKAREAVKGAGLTRGEIREVRPKLLDCGRCEYGADGCKLTELDKSRCWARRSAEAQTQAILKALGGE